MEQNMDLNYNVVLTDLQCLLFLDISSLLEAERGICSQINFLKKSKAYAETCAQPKVPQSSDAQLP